MIDTFAPREVGIRRKGSHLEGQAIGTLEGIAISDEETSWLLVLQHSYGYGRNIRAMM